MSMKCTAKLIFILGGARSGKSSYAVNLAKNINDKIAYLVPGVACDDEMKTRIENHKKMRPKSWYTIEEPLNAELALKNLEKSIKCIIFDCLSFWVSNLILYYQNECKALKPCLPTQNVDVGVQNFEPLHEEKILIRVCKFIELAKTIKPIMIIVSNEVGMGIVPDTQMGRIFRDILGKANQLVKDSADEVFFMIAGVPIKIK